MEVKIEEEARKGKAYILGTGDQKVAQMTFTRAGDALVIIDHTEVDPSLRGMGAGRQMLEKLVALARKEGIKVLPLCPYAKSVFDKDVSLVDVLR